MNRERAGRRIIRNIKPPRCMNETLAELQVRFPTQDSIAQYRREQLQPLLLALCGWYNPKLRLLPVLQWLCSPPHSMDINDNSHYATPLMRVATRGHIPFIADVLACGASMDTTVQLHVISYVDAPQGVPVPTWQNVLDVVINETGEEQKHVLLYLLDRGPSTRPAYYPLPDYAIFFLAQREAILHSTVAFLGCYKRNAWIRRYLDRHTAAMISRMMWLSRLDV